MNKKIIIFGIIIFSLALIFPPFEYSSIENLVISQNTGLPPASNTIFLPFWHNGYIYHEDELISTCAKTNIGLWYGFLGGIAFLTFALEVVLRKRAGK